MTEDEMKRQKADTLLAYQDTEQHLEHLKIKARTMGDRLIKFGTWMRNEPASMILRGDQAHHGHKYQVTPPEYLTIFEENQYFSLADEIRENEEQLRQLAQQKERLGLK